MASKKISPKPGRKRGIIDSTADFEGLLREANALQHYQLRLYITGTTPRSAQAIANIRSLCEEYLSGRYDLEVVDIYQQPGQAAEQQIIAAPTLVKELPIPPRRLIGDLSNRDKVIVGLNLKGEDPTAKKVISKTQWAKL
jgi:circadian clock protein KaiB